MNRNCKCGGRMQHVYDTSTASKPTIKISFTYRCDKCARFITQRKRQPKASGG
jgi:ribosomal protein L44E